MLNENLEKIFLEKKNSFILRRNLEALKNSLIITYYDTNEQSYIHNKIIKIDDHWEGSISIENQTFHYKEANIEKIIDKMMIGISMVFGSFFKTAATSKPLISGIITSRIIKSGLDIRTMSKAAFPLAASCT